MTLPDFWFATLGVLLVGYAVLDGFDLGAGIVHLAVKKDEDRRAIMNAIGPVWDGNEVWLITFGGALFAAFPHAYATVFSAFYTAFMLLLFALIFRAVSMEFRSKRPEPRWRSFWDGAFSVGSLLVTLLCGVAVGSSMRGIPIGADMEYAGTFWDLLGVFPVMTGLFAVALFALHGGLYLSLKTSGALQATLLGWFRRLYAAFVIIGTAVTVYAVLWIPSALVNFRAFPAAWSVVVAGVLALGAMPALVARRRLFSAFLCSCALIAVLIFLFGFALYPNLVISSLDPAWSLSAVGAASSEKTLRIMRVIAFIGMPFVLAYTAFIYWVFRGKVDTDKPIY